MKINGYIITKITPFEIRIKSGRFIYDFDHIKGEICKGDFFHCLKESAQNSFELTTKQAYEAKYEPTTQYRL